MFKIFNETYYVDIDMIDEYVQIKVPVENNEDVEDMEISEPKEEAQIHLVKYELIKNLLETVLTESHEVDEKMGPNNSELTIPFKIAFNSLLMKKIINKL
jgi:hypothetical protein